MNNPQLASSVADELRALKAENEALKASLASKIKPLTFKVSEKGAVSIYNMNARFPVTLYVGQWERLFEAIPRLQAFIAEHRSELSTSK